MMVYRNGECARSPRVADHRSVPASAPATTNRQSEACAFTGTSSDDDGVSKYYSGKAKPSFPENIMRLLMPGDPDHRVVAWSSS